MRRVFTLLALLIFALPFGIGLSGCGGNRNAGGTFCPGGGNAYVGQAQTITLLPQTGGISLNFAQSTTVQTPSAADCTGASVSIARYTYSSPDGQRAGILDVNRDTGAICAGTWNRNSPGGVPDYSTCQPTGNSGTVTLVANGNGATSNKVFVYVHPIVTDVELGPASADCVNDPATNCPQYTANLPVAINTPAYNTQDCISFGQSALLVARFYKGPANIPGNNITYSAGQATFTALTTGLVTINNSTGAATAQAPGSTVVTASVGPSGGTTTSNAGFVSVCPPKSITLNSTNAANGSVNVNVNNTEPLTATVLDTKNVTITGLNLTYTSTSPISTPVSGSGITPAFAGGAAINAFCLPPSCNPAPLAQVGRYPNGTASGNGKPVASNTLVANAAGTSSSLIWVASTDSLYLLPIDLTANSVATPTKLPFQPNSLVLTQDGSSIFLGSSSGLMTFTTGSNSVTRTDITIQGPVLAASPNSLDVVVTDPVRRLVYIYQPANGTVVSSFAGVATRAAWTVDGATAYIVTNDNHLLVWNSTTSWHSYDLSAAGTLNDVTAAIPSVGAFVGSTTAVNGRSYCPNTTSAVTDFYPGASNTTVSAAVADRLAPTNDGRHLLDVRLATANGTPILNDLLLGGGAGLPTQACPADGSTPAFTAAVNTSVLTGLLAGTVTGIYPASDSSIAFITNTPPTGTTQASGTIAAYRPAANGAGTAVSAKLTGTATAAVAGSISTDNRTFFAGTAGDNLLHFITASSLTDTSQLNPNLPSVSNPSGTAIPNLIVSRPRTSLAATGQ